MDTFYRYQAARDAGYLGSQDTFCGHYQGFRCKLCRSLEELQVGLDIWLEHYNTERSHQGKICYGRTPMQRLLDGKKLSEEKGRQLHS